MLKKAMAIIYGNDYCSPILADLPKEAVAYSVAAFEADNHILDNIEKICATHEEAVDAIYRYAPHSDYGQTINLFRNKAMMREAMRLTYPNFFFKKIKLLDLPKQTLDFTNEKKYIIKPVKGFFSIGVHIIHQHTNLALLQKKIRSEIKNQALLHPAYVRKDALSTEDFLIEEYIETSNGGLGTTENIEVALDGYYNSAGKFVLISLYYHPYKKNREHFHQLYYMEYGLYELLADKAVEFFDNLKKILNLDVNSFPLHAEFKYFHNTLFPIEINPGRFAGLGLSDLVYYAFNVNPYELFLNDKEFDWRYHWHNTNRNKAPTYFAWLLAYRGLYAQKNSLDFDHQAFQRSLDGKILHYTPITYDPSVFSIAFIEEASKYSLEKILDIDFDDYLLVAEDELALSTL